LSLDNNLAEEEHAENNLFRPGFWAQHGRERWTM
jgi:hypothetical protein